MASTKKKNYVKYPDIGRTYKVVQVDIDGEPYDVYGFDNHADILRGILTKVGISFERVEFMSGATGPALRGKRYIVRGMGIACFNTEAKEVLFYGDSYHYEINIDKNRAKRHAKFNPGWTVGE